MLALLAVRDDLRFLPGFFAATCPAVDGIIALDDGSSDGTLEYLRQQPGVLSIVQRRSDRPSWDEPGNYEELVRTALRFDPAWLISLDADERLERNFRGRAERAVGLAEILGWRALSLRLIELWGSQRTYRCDGIWGKKRVARLFRSTTNLRFDSRALHQSKAPLDARVSDIFPAADLRIYHLRMIRAEDREARRTRYELADPDQRWQPGLGYSYLTDEQGLRLRRVPKDRSFIGMPNAST